LIKIAKYVKYIQQIQADDMSRSQKTTNHDRH